MSLTYRKAVTALMGGRGGGEEEGRAKNKNKSMLRVCVFVYSTIYCASAETIILM